MYSVYLSFLVLQLSLMILWGISRRDRILQYPTLLAFSFTGYLLPQLVAITAMPSLPADAVDRTILMAVLVLAAAHFGYVYAKAPSPRFLAGSFDAERLEWGALASTMLGVYFFWKVSQLAPEAGSQWSGIITIYIFFFNSMIFH